MLLGSKSEPSQHLHTHNQHRSRTSLIYPTLHSSFLSQTFLSHHSFTSLSSPSHHSNIRINRISLPCPTLLCQHNTSLTFPLLCQHNTKLTLPRPTLPCQHNTSITSVSHSLQPPSPHTSRVMLLSLSTFNQEVLYLPLHPPLPVPSLYLNSAHIMNQHSTVSSIVILLSHYKMTI